MDTYKSDPVIIDAPAETIYSKLSNPATLQKLHDALAVPDNVKAQVTGLEFGQDSITFNINPVGHVELKVTGREENSRVEYTAVSFPVPVKAVVSLQPQDAATTLAVAELQVELNMFLRPMVEKPLSDAARRFGQMLAVIPYKAL